MASHSFKWPVARKEPYPQWRDDYTLLVSQTAFYCGALKHGVSSTIISKMRGFFVFVFVFLWRNNERILFPVAALSTMSMHYPQCNKKCLKLIKSGPGRKRCVPLSFQAPFLSTDSASLTFCFGRVKPFLWLRASSVSHPHRLLLGARVECGAEAVCKELWEPIHWRPVVERKEC